jgi:hypothetical protein
MRSQSQSTGPELTKTLVHGQATQQRTHCNTLKCKESHKSVTPESAARSQNRLQKIENERLLIKENATTDPS